MDGPLNLKDIIADADIVHPADSRITILRNIIMIQQVCSSQFDQGADVRQLIADLCVDRSKGADIPLSEIAFCKIGVLPPVLNIKAKFFPFSKTRITKPEVEAVFRGIEIGGKGRIGVMNAIGGYIAADRKIAR